MFLSLNIVRAADQTLAKDNPQIDSQQAITTNPNYIKTCESSKEFITTMEFLKTKNNIGMTGNSALAVAEDVSKGCKNSAQRFIKIYEILERSGLDVKSSMNFGMKLAQMEEKRGDVFVSIFKKSFLKSSFDLDLKSAVQTAESLSIDYKGAPEKSEKDFDELAKFCLSNVNMGGLEFSIGDCAKLAIRITKLGESYEKEIAKPFIDLYSFLLKDTQMGFTINESLKISEEVLKSGPESANNFKTIFKYAISDSGLKMEKNLALELSKKIALLSVKRD